MRKVTVVSPQCAHCRSGVTSRESAEGMGDLASHACSVLQTCWVAIKVLELINKCVQGPFAIKLVMT